MAQLFDKIVPGHGEAMYTPEGIYNTSPNRLSYHTDANADFATRFSNQLKNIPYVGPGLSLGFDVLAPATSVIPSIAYDASQAYERMEPDSGLSGWWDAFKAENPEISIPGRMAGVLSPLASRFGYEVTGSGFKSLADKRFKQQQLMNRRKQNMQKKIRQHEAATAAQQVQQVQQNIQTYGNRDRPNTGMNAPGAGKGQSPTGGDVAGTPFVRGGRVSYFDGGLASLWLR